MANVFFKKGLSTALPWSNATEGTFYLTSDTNRLYVGKADNSLAELNRYVSVVANVASLPSNPAKDDFAYITAGNILAVCTNPSATDVKNKWTQINPDTDTNTDTYLKNATAVVNSTGDNGIQVTLTFNESTKDMKTNQVTDVATPITVDFTISKNDLLAANNVSVGMGVAAAANGAKIQLEGDGINTSNKDVTIVGGDNVTVSYSDVSDEDKITISAVDTTYKVSTSNNKLILDGTTGADSEIAIKSGNDAIVASATGNEITYTHKNYDGTVDPQTATTLSHGGKFTVVEEIVTELGHVSSYKTKELTLPADQNFIYEMGKPELDANDKSKLIVKLNGSNGGTNSQGVSDSIFYYMVNGTKVPNQGSIDFYTKDEIDQKIYDVDAMTYKGTIGEGGTITQLPTSGVKVGDTYKVITAGAYGVNSCDIGDLLIATGDEVNGVINSNLTWTYVPSGDDTDSQYDLSVDGIKIVLKNKTIANDKDEVIFEAGTDLAVENGGEGKTNSIVYSHKDYASVTPGTANEVTPANGGKFTVVDSIETSNGHVTGYKVKEVTLPTITPVSSTLKAASNGVIQLDESIGTDSSVTIAAGKDIAVTTTTEGSSGTITVDHASITTTPTTVTAGTLSHSGKFTVVQAITADNGHVTGYETKEWTLPADQNATYALDGKIEALTNGGVKVTHTLDGSNGGSDSTSVIGYISDNLTIATATAGTGEDARMKINFEWGTF